MKRGADEGPHGAKRRAGVTVGGPGGCHSDDPSTLSETTGPGRARQRHLSFDIAVDFTAKQVRGTVGVTAVRGAGCGAGCELVLDTRGQTVSAVSCDGTACKYTTTAPHAALGAALRIQCPGGEEGTEVTANVEYATAAPGADGEGGCSALQWLPPQQTKGGKFPYLFSQCQAIHARSLMPCQDSCEAKVTYDARVACPAELTPLMSAVRGGEPEALPAPPPGVAAAEGCGGAWHAWRFVQKVPVPPYLIALVCGNLASKRIGPRSHVWCEGEMIDEAAHEFEEHTEKFIAAGEKICGPYEWGVYDLLVLPPSFPYGGMENPCLTFVTPTLLAGDRSQVAVIAHEITHSWSGNLVTNHTWEHFWLNEGLTVFIEYKIVRAVIGTEAEAFCKATRWQNCLDAIKRFGEEHNFTRLIPDLTGGVDPDDSFSVLPYVKGAACFEHLEATAGGEEAFAPFVRAWFSENRYSTVSSALLREKYEAAFPDAAKRVDWDELFYAPGVPPHKYYIDPKPVDDAIRFADAWIAADASGATEFDGVGGSIDGWTSLKLQATLDRISASKAPLRAATAEALCTRYSLLTKNCEVRCLAIEISLRAGWGGAAAACEKMAVSVGRMKFTRPLYRALKDFDAARARALFAAHKASYHPITAKMVARDLAS